MYYLVIIFLLVEYAVIYHVPKTPPELLNKEVKAAAAAIPAETRADAKNEQKQQINAEPATSSLPEKKEVSQIPEKKQEAVAEPSIPLLPAEKKEVKIEEAPVGKADLPPVEDKASQPTFEQITKKAEVPKEASKVIDVKIKEMENGSFTRAEVITSGGPLNYNVFNLETPDRIVVDIANATDIQVKKEILVNNPRIRRVRLGLHDDKVRVVFDFKGKIPHYDVTQEKNILIISFGKRP